MCSKRLTTLSVVLVWIVAAGIQACSPEVPTAPGDDVLLAARGGGSGGKASTEIKISAVDPDTVPADTVLTLRVLGSGFTDGSQVSWTLAGEPTTDVTTSGPVTFVSPKELHAPVTVVPDARLASYDVVVTAAGGKKGIGVEKLEVVTKFNPLPEPNWAYQSNAHDLNGSGVVVGSASDSKGDLQAMRWVPGGGGWLAEELGPGEAVAMNEQGDVVRRYWDPGAGTWRSWVLTSSGSEVYLGAVFVSGISDAGNLVGAINSGGSWPYAAWRRVSADSWAAPVLLPGTATHPVSWVSDIGDADVITGWVNQGTLGVDEWPVVWTFNGAGWDAPPAIVDAQVHGKARDINVHGAIAGASAPCASGCPYRPTFWSGVGGARQLLADPYYGVDGLSTAGVVGLNNASQIAGNAAIPAGRKGALVTHAVLWVSPAVSQYLDLGAARAAWFSEAHALSETGLVAGVYRQADGRRHAVVWRVP
ncbi:MAG: hypothetical protein Q8W46_00585 [Candidatus Palauibacterales bacterium]|nr:hypothetical protein [Candidatus Palauibacterales bacterium]